MDGSMAMNTGLERMEGPVLRNLNLLRSNVVDLRDQVSNLEEKLGPILSPAMAEKEAGPSELRPAQSGVTDDIVSINLRVSTIQVLLSNLIDRIEL